MAKRYHYTDEELLFIENNWKSMSDKEIGIHLNRKPESIGRQRKKFGWIKENGRPSAKKVQKAKIKRAVEKAQKGEPLSLSGLSKDERIGMYKKNFARANSRYGLLLEELKDTEFEYYKHKYVDFMDSVDTMTPQEEDSLHHLIMTDINISRIRRRIRKCEEEDEEDGSPMVYGLYDALEKAEKRYLEYQKALNVTREKRLAKDKEQKETIATIVQLYRNKLAREEVGRKAGLIEIFKRKAKEDMSTNRYLLGGDDA